MGLFYYFCLQDFDRALLELDEARKRSPNDGNVIFYTGLVKRRQGTTRPELQTRDLRPTGYMWALPAADDSEPFVRPASPRRNSFIAEKAETYMADGDLDAAENLLRGQDLTESKVAFGEYIAYLVYRRRFDEAVQGLSKALEEKKDLSPLWAAAASGWGG